MKKGQQAENDDRNGNWTRQKNERGDSKVESNDSPEIPDRGETSDIPGLPSGVFKRSSREQDIDKFTAVGHNIQTLWLRPS